MDRTSKTPGVVVLVDRLRCDLGQDYFVEVPHWDGEPMAIGLARPDDHRFLVYLSVHENGCEVYVECEIPASDDTAALYEVGVSGDYADYQQILGIVRSHLAR